MTCETATAISSTRRIRNVSTCILTNRGDLLLSHALLIASRLRRNNANKLLLTMCHNLFKEIVLAMNQTARVLKVQTAATLENRPQIGARIVRTPPCPVVRSHANLTLTRVIRLDIQQKRLCLRARAAAHL